MSRSLRNAVAGVLLAVSLGGCGVLEPKLPEAKPDVTQAWPLPPDTGLGTVPAPAATPAEGVTADIGWRDFFVDARLQELIGRALASNRSLRATVLDVERARAQYHVVRSARVPSVDATGTLVRQWDDDNERVTDIYTAELGITSFELDLFGRVQSLSKSALEQYLAQEEARRSAQLALIAEVANTFLTLAADREQLKLAQATVKTRQESFDLTTKRHEFGAVSALDVHQARTQLETSRADAARFAGQVAQDVNALALLVGGPIEPELLPTSFEQPVSGLAALPAELPSEVLLRRPDVLQAEHLLRSANANVGAARAAFFPSIRLTGTIGAASDDLSSLFDGGGRTWSFVPQVTIPIFEGGRLRGNLRSTESSRGIALAQYEGAIQQGFREVSDALALTSTLGEQRASLELLVDAAQKAEALSLARYEAGRDSYLVRLESQRTLYVSQQALITTRLAEQSNRVTLYKVLGGGWQEHSP